MRGALAWSILSLLKTVVFSGTKLLVKGFLAITFAKRKVNKSEKSMRKKLVKQGIPSEIAGEIADSYASLGKEFLSIRQLIRMAKDIDNFD
jgi:uncharacterized membrane protein HdeD (DUF308 family)